MELQTLKERINEAGLKEDFALLNDTHFIDQPRCGIACAPGCLVMSPAAN